MILTGARRALTGESSARGDLEIRGGKIYPCADRRDGESIDLSGLLLLPGLINAHDHLEFNLFPRLGRRIYNNAAEWAADIHRPDESPVKEHISVPLPVRLAWGGIRNLLCGATTVAHHNPYNPAVFDDEFPVRVVRDFAWAHSLDFSPDLKERFLNAPAGRPFIIHAAEGADSHAGREIERLAELGVLAPHTVLVHAIAAGRDAMKLLRRRGTSVVWCPRSNLSTYGRTLSRDDLESGVRIALGTDSAITSHGDLIDEIRTAVVDRGVSPSSVYRMVTSDAATVLRLRRGEGSLCTGGVADIVAVADEGQSPAEALLNLKPEFVMLEGRFRMVSQRMAARRLGMVAEGFQPIGIASRDTYLIDTDVARLHREAARSIGPAVRLSGRLVTVEAAA
jgi:cytosine/adenosine deaminase-related metal-dependent hydrolase